MKFGRLTLKPTLNPFSMLKLEILSKAENGLAFILKIKKYL